MEKPWVSVPFSKSWKRATSVSYTHLDVYKRQVDMECTLITPIAMDEKLRFAIREGGRTVGSGVVTKIIE